MFRSEYFSTCQGCSLCIVPALGLRPCIILRSLLLWLIVYAPPMYLKAGAPAWAAPIP